jgi:hypothetical protein
VKVDAVPFPIVNAEYVKAAVVHAPYDRDLHRHTPEATALLKKVEALVAAYNFDGSDSMTDYFHVNFYAHVDFGSSEHREYMELSARFEAEKAEADSVTRKANEAASSARVEARKRIEARLANPGPVLPEVDEDNEVLRRSVDTFEPSTAGLANEATDDTVTAAEGWLL